MMHYCELVTSQEHNYKATLGRNYDQQKRASKTCILGRGDR